MSGAALDGMDTGRRAPMQAGRRVPWSTDDRTVMGARIRDVIATAWTLDPKNLVDIGAQERTRTFTPRGAST